MINRREVMQTAWAIFRETYGYGRSKITFAAIGRKCLGWAIGEAWRRAKEAARLSSQTVAQLAARVADIKGRIELTNLSCGNGGSWTAKRQALDAELSQLRAVARDAGLNLA